MALSRSLVDGNLLYGVANYQSLYRSDDGGLTWNPLGNVGGSILPDDVDPNTAYYTYTLEGYFGVYKTTNRGASWSPFAGPTPYAPNGPAAQEFFLEAATSDGSLYGYENGTIYKSSDHGATWLAVNLPPNAGSVAIVPAAPPVLYAATAAAIYKSRDGGSTWSLSGAPPAAGTYVAAVSPVNSSVLYAVTPLAPVVYVSADSGATWNSRTLELATVSGVAPSPKDATVAYAFGTAPPAGQAAFVATLDASGAHLLFSTLLGPPFGVGAAIAVLGPGEAIVGGYAQGGLDGIAGTVQGFVTRISECAISGPRDTHLPAAFRRCPPGNWGPASKLQGAPLPEAGAQNRPSAGAPPWHQ